MRLTKIPITTCACCESPILDNPFDGNWSMDIIMRKPDGFRMTISIRDLCLSCARKAVEEHIVDVHKMTTHEMTLAHYTKKYKK